MPLGDLAVDLAVDVQGLVHRFGDLAAVDDVSFSVPTGQIFGLLGPNGAGKSTTIKILCTLLQPSQGTARVAGHDVVAAPAEVRRSLGLIFQDPCNGPSTIAEEKPRRLRTQHEEKSTRQERLWPWIGGFGDA